LHHELLSRLDLELIADADLIEVDDLRTGLDRLLDAIGADERHLAPGLVNRGHRAVSSTV
jgi:hypothetical protein